MWWATDPGVVVVSDTDSEGVRCPRGVYLEATEGSRVSITVGRQGGGTVEFSGDVTSRRKVGGENYCYVAVYFVPDGELAPVEIEAGKERGEWNHFRAFHWTQPPHAESPDDHVFQFVGRVVDVTVRPGAFSGGERASGEGIT